MGIEASLGTTNSKLKTPFCTLACPLYKTAPKDLKSRINNSPAAFRVPSLPKVCRLTYLSYTVADRSPEYALSRLPEASTISPAIRTRLKAFKVSIC